MPQILNWTEDWACFRPFQNLQTIWALSFSSMFRIIVLQEGGSPYMSQISGRLKQVFLQNFPVFSTIHHSLNSDKFPNPCRVFLDGEKVCTEDLLPFVWGVSHMPFGEPFKSAMGFFIFYFFMSTLPSSQALRIASSGLMNIIPVFSVELSAP